MSSTPCVVTQTAKIRSCLINLHCCLSLSIRNLPIREKRKKGKNKAQECESLFSGALGESQQTAQNQQIPHHPRAGGVGAVHHGVPLHGTVQLLQRSHPSSCVQLPRVELPAQGAAPRSTRPRKSCLKEKDPRVDHSAVSAGSVRTGSSALPA